MGRERQANADRPAHLGAVQVPDFLLRKLYKKGSLRETGPGRFTFTLRNPLGEATIVSPPIIVVNSVRHEPAEVESSVDLAAVSPTNPLQFHKGDELTLAFKGHLLRGGNRIHITVLTKEFGEVELFVEDREADFCELPGADVAAEPAKP